LLPSFSYNESLQVAQNICAQQIENGITSSEKNTTTQNNNNLPLVGLAKMPVVCKTEKIAAETQPDKTILPTNAYAGNMPKKLRKMYSKNSVIKTLDAYC
jgi:hypothetical protein